MKLVDADALKDALFQKHVHDGEELEPMLYLDDAMKVVDEAPTIEAIPVEWLKKCCDSYDYNLFYSIPLKQVLKSWEIEKHLQNERREANEAG